MTFFYWLAEWLASFFEGYLVLCFAADLLEKKKRPGAMFLGGGVIATIVIIMNQFSLYSPLNIVISIFINSAVGVYVLKSKWRIMIGLCLTFFTFLLNVGDLSVILLISLVIGDGSLGAVISGGVSLTRLMVVICAKLALLLNYLLIRRLIRRHLLEPMFTQHWLLVLIVSLAGQLVTIYLGNLMMSNITMILAERWIFVVVVIVVIIVAIILHYKYRIVTERKDNLELLSQVQAADFKALRQITEAEARSAHDFKNHLNIIYKYLDEKEDRAALDYVTAIMTPLQNMGQEIWTGNGIIDYILNSKKAMAEAKGIVFSIDTGIMKLNISDYEINMILANILDNAIEASEQMTEDRRIEVCIHSVNATLIIKVKNCHNHPIVKKGQKIITTKSDRRRHGLGMEIVKRTVAKSDGFMQTQYDDHIFSVLITLPEAP
ncbi:MAG: GHKL domain-containing protein [Lachnospiraceae bacterium]|jgi:signal transduction histidine kinase|nr:GHKL domain-containing protein [Lachnospiraceae bacterium]